jgi:hypothetical protein
MEGVAETVSTIGKKCNKLLPRFLLNNPKSCVVLIDINKFGIQFG